MTEKRFSGRTAGVLVEIAKERMKQQAKGHDIEHDDKDHNPGAISLCGAAYIKAASFELNGAMPETAHRVGMQDWVMADGFNPGTPRENLIKGVAMAIAEIEKIDRQAGQEPE